MPPSRIGKYEVLRPLGGGAMGQVYLAQDPLLRRQVAVKVMRPQADEGAERFLHEARTVAGLAHPNIVVLHEFGVEQDQPFLVMEFLPGESLEVWRRAPRPLAEVLRVLRGLARAVGYAHERGVLHRDLKASNVQVLPDGECKLMDFGIARTSDARLTATGILLGTPEYLAPELLANEPATPRSDLYALGVLAYELLSGKNPFAAENLAACLQRVLHHTPPSLSRARPDLPADLVRAIDACMAKRPEDRPPGVAPLLAAIERALGAAPAVAARPAPQARATERLATEAAPRAMPIPRSRRWRWGVGLAVAGGVLGGTLWLGLREPTTQAGSGAPPSAAADRAPVPASPTVALPKASAPAPPARGATESPSDARATKGESERPKPAGPDSVPPRQTVPVSPTPSVARADSQGARIAPPPASPRDTTEPTAERTGVAAPRADLDSQGAAGSVSDVAAGTRPPAAGGAPPAASSAVNATASEPPAAVPAIRPAVTAAPAPPAPPRLSALSTTSLTRGSSSTVRILGERLAGIARVEIRRGRQSARGLQVLSVVESPPGELRITLLLDEDAALGNYTLVVVDATGRVSNGLSFEVTL